MKPQCRGEMVRARPARREWRYRTGQEAGRRPRRRTVRDGEPAALHARPAACAAAAETDPRRAPAGYAHLPRACRNGPGPCAPPGKHPSPARWPHEAHRPRPHRARRLDISAPWCPPRQHHILTAERHWSADHYEQWLTRTLAAALLPSQGRAASTSPEQPQHHRRKPNPQHSRAEDRGTPDRPHLRTSSHRRPSTSRPRRTAGLRAIGQRLSPRCLTSCRTPARTCAGPVLRPGGGEADNQRVVEHEEPAERAALSKIITSQRRTGRGHVRTPLTSRGNRPSIKRSRAAVGAAELFRHASSESVALIRGAPLRSAPSPTRLSSLQAPERLGQRLRAVGRQHRRV